MILILTVIVTVTGMVLRETRLTSARIAENEEASHTASRAMDLIRSDIEGSIGLANPAFIVMDAGVDTNRIGDTDVTVGPGTNTPVAPAGTNGAGLCMVTLSADTSPSHADRAAREVFYWLVSGPSDAFPSLVRAERTLSTDYSSAYTNDAWCSDTNGLDPEIVCRFVTDFSVRCTDRNWTVSRDWTNSELPVCVDVYIEYLPESGARRLMARGALTNLIEVERSVTKSACRFFLPNRRGYLEGK